MNKLLIVVSMLVTLGVSAHGMEDESKGTQQDVKKETQREWWNQAGDSDSDYWWIVEYVDEQSE